LTAPPLVLCAGLRSSDAVDMFGLLTAYRFVLFSSSNALHAVPRRASLYLCRSTRTPPLFLCADLRSSDAVDIFCIFCPRHKYAQECHEHSYHFCLLGEVVTPTTRQRVDQQLTYLCAVPNIDANPSKVPTYFWLYWYWWLYRLQHGYVWTFVVCICRLARILFIRQLVVRKLEDF
jgi:hypothetical protein